MSEPSQIYPRIRTVNENFAGPHAPATEGTPSMEPVECGGKDKQNSQLENKSEADGSNEDTIPYITADKFFDVVLGKSHVQLRYQLQLPVCILDALPKKADPVPVVLRYNCKNWHLYYVSKRRHRFDGGWKTFAMDNNLKVGDACVFELKECSPENIRFKVHILRGDKPPELEEAIKSQGGTKGDPIEID